MFAEEFFIRRTHQNNLFTKLGNVFLHSLQIHDTGFIYCITAAYKNIYNAGYTAYAHESIWNSSSANTTENYFLLFYFTISSFTQHRLKCKRLELFRLLPAKWNAIVKQVKSQRNRINSLPRQTRQKQLRATLNYLFLYIVASSSQNFKYLKKVNLWPKIWNKIKNYSIWTVLQRGKLLSKYDMMW